MANKEAVVVSCGATFTAVGTSENVVYFWGTRFISPTARPSTRDAFGQVLKGASIYDILKKLC